MRHIRKLKVLFFKILIGANCSACLQWSCLILFFGCSVYAQKIAFLNPEKNQNERLNKKIKTILSEKYQILDDSLAESVSASFPDLNFFNLSTEEARNLGQAVGCNFFVVTKNQTLRRESLSKSAYFESYLVIYIVSSRTGQLAFWKILSFEGATANEAERELSASVQDLASELLTRMEKTEASELSENPPAALAVLPDENSPAAKNFRSPLPYRRLKPEYTATADLYGVTATVDATVDLDEKGNVLRVEITRWAGYGLDESVKETIKKMQWRAAESNGKALPIRVLLRYNFRKPKTEEEPQE